VQVLATMLSVPGCPSSCFCASAKNSCVKIVSGLLSSCAMICSAVA